MKQVRPMILLIALASAPALGQMEQWARPVSDPRDWITFADYPWRDAKGDFAAINYELQVNQSGAVTRCQAKEIEFSPHPGDIFRGFPALTCRILQQRAKFFPAVDSSGSNSLRIYSGGVVWSRYADNDGQMVIKARLPLHSSSPVSVPPPPLEVSPPRLEVPSPPPRPRPTVKPAPVPRATRLLINPSLLVTQADYPARALREKREGTVQFKISVGADGRPTGCMIVKSSGHADLDEATCMLVMRRARFNSDDSLQPANNRTYSNRIRWVVPYTGEPAKPLPSTDSF